MQIDSIRIDLLETGSFGLDGGAMFGVVPKTLWTRAYSEADDRNRIPMSARALLVRTPDRTILVDSGNGDKFDEKFASIYKVDNSIDTLERSLAAHGLAPADIDDVLITHLHFDHAGGLTRREANGELVPRFPNARYHVQRAQLEWARNPSVKDRASYLPENYEPLAAAGLLDLIDGRHEFLPGIELLPVEGHTPALQMIKIGQGRHSALFCSDLCPTHGHVRIPFVMGYDNEPLKSIAAKEEHWPQAYEEEWAVIFQHDAFHEAARLHSGSRGFELGDFLLVNDQNAAGNQSE